MSAPTDQFPRDASGLPAATAAEFVELADGERVRVADRAGQQADRRRHGADAGLQRLDPGPDAEGRGKARRSRSMSINEGDLEATVHWHGLRLDNRYDGTHETQAPIPVGGRFTYRVTFPDPGVYWYHPHIREDYGQEMGLYGNVLVEPADADYWPPVAPRGGAHARRRADRGRPDRAVQPRRDDVRGDGPLRQRPADRRRARARADRQAGEVVRFYLTNTANTRVFKVKLPGARMKLVGGDSGRVRARAVRRGGRPRAVGARGRRRAVRAARRAGAGAPHA